MDKLILILILLLIFSCSNNRNFENMPEMPEQQKGLLLKHQQKSVDLAKHLNNSEVIPIRQAGNIKKFPFEALKKDSIKLKHPDHITVSQVIETENYFFLNNIVQSTQYSNIAKFSKDGKFIKSIGRKGKGPGEITSIGVLTERRDTTFLFDNGYIKKFNKNLEELGREFVGLWVYKAFMWNQKFALKIAANEYFPYPVTIVDKDGYEIQLSIKDNRPDVFNTTSNDNNTFFANKDFMIYAKTTQSLIHVLKIKDKNFSHYKVISEIIRENEKTLREGATGNEFAEFFKNLFMVAKLHYCNGNLWILFRDKIGENAKKYLAKVADFPSQSRELSLKVFDVSTLTNSNINFYKDHLNLSKSNDDNDETTIYQMNLEHL